MTDMGTEVMDKEVVNAKLNRLQLEEREIVAAMAKLKELKNKLKVEELTIMAALRGRSVPVSAALQPQQAVASPSATSADARQPTPSTPPGPSSAPQLQLSVPCSTVPGYDEEEEDEDDL